MKKLKPGDLVLMNPKDPGTTLSCGNVGRIVDNKVLGWITDAAKEGTLRPEQVTVQFLNEYCFLQIVTRKYLHKIKDTPLHRLKYNYEV